MKAIKRILIVLVSAVGIFSSSSAYALGETGAQFLKIGVGARACAVGEAYTALSDDATAIYWNPAGLAQLSAGAVTAMQNFWLMDMSYQYAAVAVPVHYGGFGLAVAYSSSGEIPKFEDFQQVGDYSAYDAAGTIAYATRIGRCLSSGVGLKLVQQKIEEESATGFAVDVGLLCSCPTIKGISMGLVAQNLGPAIKFIDEPDPLPWNVKFGVGYSTGPLTLACDVMKPRDDDMRVGAGGEFVIKSVLALRGGYNSANTYTAGAGLAWRRISAGYTFVPYEDIDDSHRISLTVEF